jgi:hypothetical protein
MPGPYSSFGTLLQMGDGGGPEVFTTVAQVMDMDGPDFSTDTEETTNHSSPGAFEEFLATIKRSGEVTFDINFDPNDPTHDQTTGLIAAYQARTMKNWRMLMPTSPAKRWDFKGIVTGMGQANPVAGILRSSVTIKISGQPTLV